MGGGNAFLRFSSSVAAGALILPQVARAQNCDAPERPPGGNGCCAPVNDYEGCGSCEDPTLRFLTTVESSSSESLTISTTLKYTNCAGDPFPNTGNSGQGSSITLEDINSDITTLRSTLTDCTDNNDVSVVSFPCMTDSSRRVLFNDPNALFPRLEKIRFANLVTVGDIRIRSLPALISIYAPLLVESSRQIAITFNNLLPKIDFPSLSGVGGEVDIGFNDNLKKISLPQLTTANEFVVEGNRKLKKLCASKLDDGSFVCIGNDQDQPFLDADLSELVTGILPSGSPCSGSNASTVCGSATGGLFSTAGCPSNACS